MQKLKTTNKAEDIILTDDQQFIFDSITSKIDNNPGRYNCVIKGYAGTGKSTTVSEIIKWANLEHYSVAVTSPTHKANQVLRNMIGDIVDVPVKTIHSYLGLELKQVKEEQVLTEISGFKPEMVDILIIDECSMISLEMYQHICKKLKHVRRCVLFVGDDCQLPPVDNKSTQLNTSTLSKTFTHGTQYSLTKVLRQAEANSIIKLATEVRKCVFDKSSPIPHIKAISDDNENIIKINDNDVFVYSYIEALAGETAIEEAIDKYKLICYLNRDVDEINHLVRNVIYDNPPEEFIIGENIIVQNTVENTKVKTQEQIKINKSLTKIKMFGLDVWRMDYNDEIIRFVGPESRIAFNNLLKRIVTHINLKQINPQTKKPYTWGDYYLVKKSICEMNYPYALTYHKSQGSTYDTAWMSMNYVNRVPDNKDMARMLYTAMTRPRNSLVILDK